MKHKRGKSASEPSFPPELGPKPWAISTAWMSDSPLIFGFFDCQDKQRIYESTWNRHFFVASGNWTFRSSKIFFILNIYDFVTDVILLVSYLYLKYIKAWCNRSDDVSFSQLANWPSRKLWRPKPRWWSAWKRSRRATERCKLRLQLRFCAAVLHEKLRCGLNIQTAV